jgi:hypothetical protein
MCVFLKFEIEQSVFDFNNSIFKSKMTNVWKKKKKSLRVYMHVMHYLPNLLIIRSSKKENVW